MTNARKLIDEECAKFEAKINEDWIEYYETL